MKWFHVLAALAVTLAVTPAYAGPYAASADVESTIMVSGNWTSIQWYESDGCYSGVGDPAVEDWKTWAQNDTPISLSTGVSDSQGSAYSTIEVFAGPPTIDITSSAEVHDVVPGPGGEVDYHWAYGYSEGGANWLTSGADQTVDVTIDYAFELGLTQGGNGGGFTEVKIYVAFWDGENQPSGPNDLLLTEDAEWVRENSGAGTSDYLVKTVTIDTAGLGSGYVIGSETWQVDVGAGLDYSFWGMASADAWTVAVPEPATLSLVGLGALALLIRRRKR